MIEMVIIIPDCVSRVIYQRMAYWTSEDPNKEIVWLVRNNIMFFFQLSKQITLLKLERLPHPVGSHFLHSNDEGQKYPALQV